MAPHPTENNTMADHNDTFLGLREELRTGRPLTVEFKKGIEDCEGYAESGMRATIVAIESQRDGVMRVTMDFSAFDAFNKPFESANYYDKNGQPTKTAREAGSYSVREDYYFGENDSVFKYLAMIEPANELLTQWRNSGSQDSYTTFLEKRIGELRGQVA